MNQYAVKIDLPYTHYGKKNYSWFSSDSSMDKSKRSFWVLDQILSAQGLHISSSANKNMRGLVAILSNDENDFFFYTDSM